STEGTAAPLEVGDFASRLRNRITRRRLRVCSPVAPCAAQAYRRQPAIRPWPRPPTGRIAGEIAANARRCALGSRLSTGKEAMHAPGRDGRAVRNRRARVPGEGAPPDL